MRTPDKTLIFGSNTNNPVSQRAPVSMRAPVSRPLEKRWFAEPAPLSEPLLDRRGTLRRRSPERGLAFAAIALVLIGVAGAGTYFFFGLNNTAHREENANQVDTTMVTNAEVPATTAAVSASATAEPSPSPAPLADLPWQPPVVDAVKSPDLPPVIHAAQVPPAARTAAPAATVAPAPTTTPGFTDEGATPAHIPSADDPDNTSHMEPLTNENTMHNPDGEPAMNNATP